MASYNDLMTMTSYELADEMQAVLTRFMATCEKQDDARNQEEYDRLDSIKKEASQDLSHICTAFTRVVANEENTEKERAGNDLFKKYANRYFRYVSDWVVFFEVGEDRSKMSFDSIYICDKPTLQVTSNCHFKKRTITRTSWKDEDGWDSFGKYTCDMLEEITKEEFDDFFLNKSIYQPC